MKYTINLDFFKEPSRELSYVLGFFMADGYMYKNEFGFYISNKDEEILLKMREVMGSSHPIRQQTSKWGTYSRLRINNKSLTELVSNMGFVFPKTGREFIPEICKPFMYDFIRGIIDGDGTVGIVRNKEPRVSIVCVSNYFLSQLLEFLGHGGIHQREKYSMWSMYKTQDIQDLSTKLYLNTDLYLTRKKLIFDEISNIELKAPRFSDIEDTFIIHNINTLKPKEIAKSLKRPVGSIYSRISTLKKKEII
jgi:hypothetical protein